MEAAASVGSTGPSGSPAVVLAPSSKLSIGMNPPVSFAGRKVGVLISDGADAGVIAALRAAANKEGASLEFIAPRIAGVALDDGSWLSAHHMIGGGPSVLFDAVAVVVAGDAVDAFAAMPAVRDFISDAHVHCKFVAYTPACEHLVGGIVGDLDDGYLNLAGRNGARTFIRQCRSIRLWAREFSAQGPDATIGLGALDWKADTGKAST